MINDKVGFHGNLEALTQLLGTEAPEPIANAASGTEIATINAILAVLRARGLVAEAA